MLLKGETSLQDLGDNPFKDQKFNSYEISRHALSGRLEEFMQADIVGMRYRNSEYVQKFRSKGPGTKILLVPEPGNPYDDAAIAVFSAIAEPSGGYSWRHVGYVPKCLATELEVVWPRNKDRVPLVVEASKSAISDTFEIKASAGNIKVRTYN